MASFILYDENKVTQRELEANRKLWGEDVIMVFEKDLIPEGYNEIILTPHISYYYEEK